MLTKSQILSAIRSPARKLRPRAPRDPSTCDSPAYTTARLIPHFPGYRAAILAAGIPPHPGDVRIDTAAIGISVKSKPISLDSRANKW
jgi:hypothetical protein